MSNSNTFSLRWDSYSGSFRMDNGSDSGNSKSTPVPFVLNSYTHNDTHQFGSYESQKHPTRTSSFSNDGKRTFAYGKQRDVRDNPFYCKNCDRKFSSKKSFDEHCSEHVKCGVEGCPYTAHFKLILQHFQIQHCSGGISRQIWKLDTPEDIEKWRAERRKNYPTMARVNEMKEKMEESAKKIKIDDSVTENKLNHSEKANNHHTSRFPKPLKGSLLEKVLAGDLARERLFILQCIRHLNNADTDL